MITGMMVMYNLYVFDDVMGSNETLVFKKSSKLFCVISCVM